MNHSLFLMECDRGAFSYREYENMYILEITSHGRSQMMQAFGKMNKDMAKYYLINWLRSL